MKVVAVASIGGHWVQLLRLKNAFKDMDVVYMSTNSSLASNVLGHTFYAIPDFSRATITKLIPSFYNIYKLMRRERPDFVISTGAAPGLMALIAGKMVGSRTIWIDSIANVEKLSLSGKIASRVVDRIYTQWPDLANANIVYAGNVLS